MNINNINSKNIPKLFRLHIMKALGWYISMHKDIRQNEIAAKMNVDASLINHIIISPKNAPEITEENYEKYHKRLIEIERAINICKHMGTTLENVLYYYQFHHIPDILTKIDQMEKITNQLTNSENEQEKLSSCSEFDIETVQQEKNDLIYNLTEDNNLIMNIDHPEFHPWLGKYFCYFSSTSSDEADKRRKETFDKYSDDPELQELLECSTDEYIFGGIIHIGNQEKKADNLCHVELKFLSNPNKRLIKRYFGILMLSAKTKAVFCELTNAAQGEKTYLILEKQDLGKEHPNIRCCMAMVLTYSSQVNRRRPCCERMIISNKMIREGTEEYDAMKAYLRMNDSTIRITQWGYHELIKDIVQSSDPDLLKIAENFPTLQSLDGRNVTIENCAFIPESIIYTLNSLSDAQKRKFEILLRNHSLSPWYSKTKATKADTLFKLLNRPT